MPTKVYVGNLPDNCSPDTLRDVFGSYGVIKELDVIKNFAFVHFAKEEDAKNSVRDLDNTKMLGSNINVQLSTKQRSNRDHRDDRRPPRRGPLGPKPIGGPIPPLGGIGGILGAAPAAAPLGGLGILSAVNTLAAAAEQQQRNNEFLPDHRRDHEQPDPDVRVRREVVNTHDVPGASRLGLSNGYVIYERYYVDPSHPLLKGLPLPDLPRITDTFVARDSYRADPFGRREGFDEFRDRSPINGRRDFNRDAGPRDFQAEYFERR